MSCHQRKFLLTLVPGIKGILKYIIVSEANKQRCQLQEIQLSLKIIYFILIAYVFKNLPVVNI